MTGFDGPRRFAQRTDDPLALDVRKLLDAYDTQQVRLAWFEAKERAGRSTGPPVTPPVNVDPRRGAS